MRKLRTTNITIFLLFFGVSTIVAIQSHDWLRSLFWLAIGFVFLFADRFSGRRNRPRDPQR